MRTKMALHLVKGDTIMDDRVRCKILTVIKRNDDRIVECQVQLPKDTGKKVMVFKWNEDVPLYGPSDKRLRYGFLMWLGRVLRAPVKRSA